MTNRKRIRQTIEEILIDHRWINPSRELDENADFQSDLGMDSLDKVEMIMDIEREYGISIPDYHAERLTTVGNTIDYLQKILE